MSLTCYIVDDEFHAIEILSDFITKTDGLELIGSSTKPLKALELISTGISPHITFLDVDMPELSGLEFAGLVNNYTDIIFTTSYREYALEAFEKQAVDYLLKPISYERFLKSIQKIRKNALITNTSEVIPEPFLFVKVGTRNKFVRIQTHDIKYIIAALHYIEIYVKEQKVVTYMGISDVLSNLPPQEFSRIHKSYIVNHNFINTLEYDIVIMTDKAILPIGRAFRKDFHQKLKASFSGPGNDQPE
jgi:two-component system LytT family response regulator